MESLADLVSAISSFAIIFGGVVPFIPQYLVIRKQNDAEGFSTFVCFTLLIANILRIIFWFYKGYELPLLYQSGFMVMVQMVMLELCVRINSINHISSKPRLFLDFKTKDFWKWTNIDDYMYFLISFTGVVSFVTFVLYDYTFYQELLGFLSLLIEASLGLPQWYKNFQHKSTEGMSVGMVLGWTSGDFFKTGYFLVRSAPLQFVVCGVLQICVDLAIFYQIFTYPKKGKSHLLKK